MIDELVKKYEQVGIVHTRAEEWRGLKEALEDKGYRFHVAWDNGMQMYIFTENEGGSLL